VSEETTDPEFVDVKLWRVVGQATLHLHADQAAAESAEDWARFYSHIPTEMGFLPSPIESVCVRVPVKKREASK